MANSIFLAAILLIIAANSALCQRNSERWTMWSRCTKACGVGTSTRTRICTFPFSCSSTYRRVQHRTCIAKTCQEFCGRWSDCSQTCGYGVQVRRNCFDGKIETAQCFSPCPQVCENSIMGQYRHPSSPCCTSTSQAQCGVSAVMPDSFQDMSEKVTQKTFPWTVRVKVGMKTCLGAIISEHFVITSAKCVYRKFLLSIKVISGTTLSHYFDNELQYERDTQVRGVSDVIIYPRFNNMNYADYNIALLKLRTPLQFTSDFIRPICLPRGENVPDGSTCVALDFISGSETLVPTNLHLQPVDDCARNLGNYKIGLKKAASQIAGNRIVCAGQLMSKHYSCQGSAGSALMCQRCSSCSWMLYGITSYGDKRCTTITRPGIFTKTSYFEAWILKKTGMQKSAGVFPSCTSK